MWHQKYNIIKHKNPKIFLAHTGKFDIQNRYYNNNSYYIAVDIKINSYYNPIGLVYT